MDARHEIENLLYSYAERIDAGDFEGVAELFRHGSIADDQGNTVGEGYEGVLALYRASTRLYANGTPGTRHVTTNLILDIDASGTAAQGRAYFTVFQQVEDFPLQAIIAGRYRDSFECVEGRWRFHRRQMFPEQLGDLSRHLLFDLD